ncbi:MAG: hypothetical protein EOM02_11255, partial [Synergistales bacterium]|nr:hypothetical protein [Synergistales bacterium]
MLFSSADALAAVVSPRVVLPSGGKGSLMEDLRQIGHVAMLLSPFTLISFLWIFTLRRKVNAQTSVLKEELARLERAERE